MQLNDIGSLLVTMGLLPAMVAKRRSHVVNISSVRVLVDAPRFPADVASKAALDAWTSCAASEFADPGITFTTVNMPLPSTDEASDLIVQTCVDKPVRVATRLGISVELLQAAVPRISQILMNTTFRMSLKIAAATGMRAARRPGHPKR